MRIWYIGLVRKLEVSEQLYYSHFLKKGQFGARRLGYCMGNGCIVKMRGVKWVVLLTCWIVEENETVTNYHQLGSIANQVKLLFL